MIMFVVAVQRVSIRHSPGTRTVDCLNTANAHTEGEHEYTLNVTQTDEDNTSLWFSN